MLRNELAGSSNQAEGSGRWSGVLPPKRSGGQHRYALCVPHQLRPLACMPDGLYAAGPHYDGITLVVRQELCRYRSRTPSLGRPLTPIHKVNTGLTRATASRHNTVEQHGTFHPMPRHLALPAGWLSCVIALHSPPHVPSIHKQQAPGHLPAHLPLPSAWLLTLRASDAVRCPCTPAGESQPPAQIQFL